MAAASDLARHRDSAAAARAAVSGRAEAAAVAARQGEGGQPRRSPPRPSSPPPSVPAVACRPLPEPASGLPGAPAGPDTKGCAEEGFVQSHEAAQPVSAELGGGSGAAAIARRGGAGQPGAAAAGPRARGEPPGPGRQQRGAAGTQVMPARRRRGRGWRTPSLGGGRGDPGGFGRRRSPPAACPSVPRRRGGSCRPDLRSAARCRWAPQGGPAHSLPAGLTGSSAGLPAAVLGQG